jgi:hypothetical protein
MKCTRPNAYPWRSHQWKRRWSSGWPKLRVDSHQVLSFAVSLGMQPVNGTSGHRTGTSPWDIKTEGRNTANPQITVVCTVTDPEEWQRRLSQVYGLLLDLAREKRLAERRRSDKQVQLLTDGTAVSAVRQWLKKFMRSERN